MKLIFCEYSQTLLELSSLSLRQEQMREISQPTQIEERGAGVATCESQLVISLLEPGSECTARQQPQLPHQQPQQHFETEENRMVDVGREIVELETRGKEQEELLLPLPPKQQQQLQPPTAPPPVCESQLAISLLETGSESPAQQQPPPQHQE